MLNISYLQAHIIWLFSNWKLATWESYIKWTVYSVVLTNGQPSY